MTTSCNLQLKHVLIEQLGSTVSVYCYLGADLCYRFAEERKVFPFTQNSTMIFDRSFYLYLCSVLHFVPLEGNVGTNALFIAMHNTTLPLAPPSPTKRVAPAATFFGDNPSSPKKSKADTSHFNFENEVAEATSSDTYDSISELTERVSDFTIHVAKDGTNVAIALVTAVSFHSIDLLAHAYFAGGIGAPRPPTFRVTLHPRASRQEIHISLIGKQLQLTKDYLDAKGWRRGDYVTYVGTPEHAPLSGIFLSPHEVPSRREQIFLWEYFGNEIISDITSSSSSSST